jgi:pimeloyl-ACP methyl ester carboxylesterase
MRLLDWVSSGSSLLGRGAHDSRRAVAFLRHTLRGNRIPPLPPVTSAGGRPPVLLIHGYLATRGSLRPLAQSLSGLGHPVLTYRLGVVHAGDICTSAARIAAKVESIAAQTGIDRIDIVGHSMGGLVGLYYVKRMGGRRRVRRLVLLGTPTAGTWSAVLGLGLLPLGRGSLQLLPDSAFLRALEAGPLPEGVEVHAVAGAHDWLAPPSTTRLRGGRHLCLPTNHAGLLLDDEVARTVSRILSAPDPAPRDQSRIGAAPPLTSSG